MKRAGCFLNNHLGFGYLLNSVLAWRLAPRAASLNSISVLWAGYWLLWLVLCPSAHAAQLRPEGWQPEAGYRQNGGAIEVAEWVEDGAFVPLTLHLAQAQPPLSISLTRSDDAEPRIAQIHLQSWQPPLQLSTRVRLPKTQAVEVWIRDGAGQQWHFRQRVQVLGSSCYAPQLTAPVFGPPQVSLQPQARGLALRTLLAHPMETGLRQNAQGQPVAQHLLKSIEVSHGPQILLQVTPYAGLAANPYWHWLLPAKQQSLNIRWQDQDGRVWQRLVP